MNQPEQPLEVAWYDVWLGFSRVRVASRSPEEAIEQARRILSLELPRLYDVIHRLDRSRFSVQRATDVDAPHHSSSPDRNQIPPGTDAVWL